MGGKALIARWINAPLKTATNRIKGWKTFIEGWIWVYVLLVSHGPGFIEMPSLHTAKSNKSWLFSLAGCLGSDVRVCNPRPEECKRVLSSVHLGWGKSWKKGRERMIGQCLVFFSQPQMRSNVLTMCVDAQALSELGCSPPLLTKWFA